MSYHCSLVGGSLGGQTTSELFRSDLITAMKLPDSHYLEPSNYIEIKEQWRSEWEIGVQVCVSPESIPAISYRTLDDEQKKRDKDKPFIMPTSFLTDEVNHSLSSEEILYRGRYEIDELDMAWLESVNEKRKYKILAGSEGLTETVLRKSIFALEKRCYQNIMKALTTEESLKIEYDHSIVCDVCKDPDREDKNEMVFCDLCNVCVHQACYGIQIIPRGSWICRPCSSSSSHVNRSFDCVLCPNRGGAMKRIKPGVGWAHMTCALWIPEVKIGNIDKMEPITNIENIPNSRLLLLCCICRDRKGACIQCSYPTCVASYHVTCGFKAGLEMKSLLNATGVRHESYCPRHTTLRKTPSKQLLSPTTTRRREGKEKEELTPLESVEERFYEYTSHNELSQDMKISLQLSLLIYNYWKLKRKCNRNQPLLLGLHLDLSYQRLQAGRRNNVQVGQLTEDEDFLTIVNLRHNLEKARNLLYMTQRRERLKLLSLRLSHDITQLELKQMTEEKEKEREEMKREELLATTSKELTRRPLTINRHGLAREMTTPTSNGLHTLINAHPSNESENDKLVDIRTLRKRAGSRSEATPIKQLKRSSDNERGVVNVLRSKHSSKTILC